MRDPLFNKWSWVGWILIWFIPEASYLMPGTSVINCQMPYQSQQCIPKLLRQSPLMHWLSVPLWIRLAAGNRAIRVLACNLSENPQGDSGFQNLDFNNTSNSNKLVRKQGSLQQWDIPVAAHWPQPPSLILSPSRLPLTRRAVTRILAAIETTLSLSTPRPRVRQSPPRRSWMIVALLANARTIKLRMILTRLTAAVAKSARVATHLALTA